MVPVTLNVTAALTPNPSTLTFTFTVGGSNPPSQNVAVTSTGATFNVSSGATTSWRSVSQKW